MWRTKQNEMKISLCMPHVTLGPFRPYHLCLLVIPSVVGFWQRRARDAAWWISDAQCVWVQTSVPLTCHKYIYWYGFTVLPNTMSFRSFAVHRIPGLLPATTTIKFNGMRSAFVCMLDSHSQLNFQWKFTYMLGWFFSLLALGILFCRIFFPFTWAYYCLSDCFLISLCSCCFFFHFQHKMLPLLSGEKHFFRLFSCHFFFLSFVPFDSLTPLYRTHHAFIHASFL